MPGKTLYDKLWEEHVVRVNEDGSTLLYIDRQLLHEVTSPQAFESLRETNRKPWQAQSNFAVPDHNVPTINRDDGIKDSLSHLQIETLNKNCEEFGIREFSISDIRHGIVHVIGPEQGIIVPGMTIVCGDSHTSTHGALGALAFGIGTSEVEHVLVTQCLLQKKMKNMKVEINGKLQHGITAKDIILSIVGKIGIAGATGYAVEFAGEVIESLSMEGRMTVCNMAIEAGARSALVAVDDKTIEYVKGRPFAPKGELWTKAREVWRNLRSDDDAIFDKVYEFDASEVEPQVTWGTSPEMVLPVNGQIPDSKEEMDPVKRTNMEQALMYMGLESGTAITEINLDRIFIGSCTNSRIEDMREAATIARGRNVALTVKQAIVVPGSGLVKRKAEQEGLDEIFRNAGFEWREAGCSMCLAMNGDSIQPGEHCASTSNRNFEGRQGPGGRTHLVSPAMAAAAAITGHFIDVRDLKPLEVV